MNRFAMAALLLVAACGSDPVTSSTSEAGSTAQTSSTSEAGSTAQTSSTSEAGSTAQSPGDHRVALAFWPGSQLDTTSGAPPIPSSPAPRITLEFTWADSTECFVWVRNVAQSAGGGTRTNTATDFDLQQGADGVWTFTYRQNAARCGEGFATDGTVKTYRSDVLTADSSTGQTGDALWAGVVEAATP